MTTLNSNCENPFALNLSHPILSLLNSSLSLSQLKQIHAHMITSSLILSPFAVSRLIKSLSLSPVLLPYASRLFDYTPSPDLFSFNTLIRALSNSPYPCHSLSLFATRFCHLRLLPNHYTFSFLLHACSKFSGLLEGTQIHTHTLKHGFTPNNLYVSNTLLHMYVACDRLWDACQVFEECPHRDLISWNSMIAAYVQSGDMSHAQLLFDKMPVRDVVSWGTLISGYTHTERASDALYLFRELLLAGEPAPNEFVLVSTLSACADSVALDQGKWIHTYIASDKRRSKKLVVNERVVAALIDMYAKCGEIRTALQVFEESTKQTASPWNAAISGLATHGCASDALDLFSRMEMAGIVPRDITFVAVLNACSHAGLVAEGQRYFELMRNYYGLVPTIKHYGCMVDLLGRAGLLKEAKGLISKMPMKPDAAIWGALLSACRIHGDTVLAEQVGRELIECAPLHTGCHVLLSNIYSSSGRWRDAKDVRALIERIGVKKIPGCTSIELKGAFHQFLVGDRSHPQTREIYSFLDEMLSRLRLAGYVPESTEVLMDLAEEDKETALSWHSEKLAIAFGLINTPPGTPIRIVKNLRVCSDCHNATKFISKVYEREIVVRDRARFHHFKDGSCSCKEYW
ncbi:pentatricopeptide repeat-containing protein At5g66520-like [Amborella trichopoda]|uniref:pentatricopeptide repeat-containing protein At5g66520-like n=1 Tax=Amborella trichopoda TaxID=13333 RepID=UPI0005D2EA2C|nr:pentatricopeptide repeat-containing protein At5g66520-like [Amborella trichopoda]XP_011623124.1 pentatricopeptide repeat-containing protein At5g66520-like [Amborella trichopoda]XP_020522463.1 pentatricopeptide repeat-containing protein At5g66520-like [Amborella trichopoda]XP_020522464.1 pentatricopeptide repeat-containing protein At5g66520-like [Amborella trichopoda]XP_020522465.1 pentatricopeptide repeat-containing protein At5g66520-like [Amborella trichopoda]XP_020522466.1 pentatricopepti|eukprot:XP_011623123.1 pentatricopeptide repeat-containing protein At5g66520-like [Amborella trichopoda]